MLLGQDEDLRKVYTSDGKQTWYDRLQPYMRESDMERELYAKIIAYKDLPVGTKANNDGPEYLGAQLMETIANYRAKAYFKLAQTEAEIANKDRLFKNERLLTIGRGRETTFSPFLK